MEIAAKALHPNDFTNYWKHSHLGEKIESTADKEPPEAEYDLFALLDFKKEGKTYTTVNLQLQQNSFSDRDPLKKPSDFYKGIGRVRHERVDIKISTVFNIQIHSYQSKSKREEFESGEVGSYDHFEILIFRNTNILPGECFEKLSLQLEDDALFDSHNEQARARLLEKFLNGEDTGSRLDEHLETTTMLSRLYATLAEEGEGIKRKVFV